MAEDARSLVRSIVPHPAPLRHGHPRIRRATLLVVSGIGSIAMVALLAAALAPSGQQPYRPVGGVAGVVGLLASLWIGWYALRMPVRDVARDDAAYALRRRDEARRLLVKDPELATQLGIGRPDLHRAYDDGGLIDVNHVPAALLAGLPGIDPALARRIATVRDEIDGFDSLDDLANLLELVPTDLEPWTTRLVFRRV